MAIDTASLTEADFLAYSSLVYLPTGFPGQVVPVQPTDPPPQDVEETSQVAVGGPLYAWQGEWTYPLAKSLQRAVHRHGDAACEWMMLDAKVRGSVLTILETVLADGLHLAPRIEEELSELGLPVDPAQSALAQRSREITDFCARSLKRMDPTPEEWTAQMLRGALVKRAMLAEKVLDFVDYGTDSGKFHLGKFQVLPRAHWQFAVDDFGTVVGYEVQTQTGRERLDLDHFALLTWLPQDGEPQGSLLLEAAYIPWEFKARLWERYFDFTAEFASPSLVATTPEGAKPRLPRDPDTGIVLTGSSPVSPEKDLLDALRKFRTQRIIVSPHGTVISPLEIKGEGAGYLNAFGVLDQEIVFAIVQVTRATLEAQHGSRADSQTAQDVLGVLVRFTKLLVASMWEREILYPLVELNYGPEAADTHTPEALLGDTERQDFAPACGAIASLYNCGLNSPLTWADRSRVLAQLGIKHSRYAKPMLAIQAALQAQPDHPPGPAAPTSPPGQSPPPPPSQPATVAMSNPEKF